MEDIYSSATPVSLLLRDSHCGECNWLVFFELFFYFIFSPRSISALKFSKVLDQFASYLPCDMLVLLDPVRLIIPSHWLPFIAWVPIFFSFVNGLATIYWWSEDFVSCGGRFQYFFEYYVSLAVLVLVPVCIVLGVYLAMSLGSVYDCSSRRLVNPHFIPRRLHLRFYARALSCLRVFIATLVLRKRFPTRLFLCLLRYDHDLTSRNA